MKSSESGKAKLFLIIFFLFILVLGGFSIYQKFLGGDIALEIKVPDTEVQLAVPFDMEIMFTNNSQNDLRSVRLNLVLPDGIIAADGSDQSNFVRELGDISSGATHRESFQVIAVPSEGQNYKPEATAFYSPSSLAAEFKKRGETEVKVKPADFELQIEAPETVFPGEEFGVSASYKKHDELEFSNAELYIDYPDGFAITGTDPEPTIDESGWLVDDLGEQEGKVTMRGDIESPEGANFEVGARLSLRIFGKEYPFMKEVREVAVEPSPLSFNVSILERGDSVQPGDKLTYVFEYRNNTNVDLRDIVIRAQLAGEMFDLGTLETDGAFNSFGNRLTWTSGDVGELKNLGPGQGGRVTFNIGVKETFNIRKLNDRDFTLAVDARIESPTVPYLIDADRTLNTSKIETKVAGQLNIETLGFFRDAQSGIVNAGPVPPRVGAATNFTIHWRLANLSTDVDEIEVRARLENGVNFTGTVKGNTEPFPEFNSATREVVWHVGRLLATTGKLGEKPEVIFQVAATPNQSQVGEYMPILGETVVRGMDEFTGISISSTGGGITTQLPDDKTVQGDSGLVTE